MVRRLLPSVLLLASACAHGVHAPMPRTPVDLARYAGTWYEIARLPTYFERDCVAARADYTILPSGRIGVTNSCRTRDGREQRITGEAEVVDRTTNARLLVRFDTWFAPFMPAPSGGNYWILDVAADYQTAIVASPDRSHLWFLARDPSSGGERLPGLVARAQEMGFPVERLVRDDWTDATAAPPS